ncbi:hypothetical protein C9382_31015 [Pseudomonas aylmerensis]|uniref:Uncharacterized protein n=1 Tax=Pseudomonas aylmerensis TaxID=1869229 RepID=A0A2T4FIL0_9PSED|nr:hypothetical protein C9382_31015 [Pseudomonas aylmerensis]
MCGNRASVGAGLARDAGTSVSQKHRGDAIAGKPAPTENRLSHKPAPTLDRRRCSEQLTEPLASLPVACAAALGRTGHRSSPAPASVPGTSHG